MTDHEKEQRHPAARGSIPVGTRMACTAGVPDALPDAGGERRAAAATQLGAGARRLAGLPGWPAVPPVVARAVAAAYNRARHGVLAQWSSSVPYKPLVARQFGRTMRTFVIGDIHGWVGPLCRVLEKIRPRAERGDRFRPARRHHEPGAVLARGYRGIAGRAKAVAGTDGDAEGRP